MQRLTAKDFPPEALELYDHYVHGRISKREFLDRAAKVAVAGMTAGAMLDLLSPNYAMAEQVSFTDPAIVPLYITYPSPEGNGDVRAYLVTPAGATGKLAAVVVVHENRGLNPYIEDVARRLAKAGFIALAPDGLSSVGGYPGNDEKGKELQATVDPAKLLNDFLAAVDYLQASETTTGKVGIVGFCWGGGTTNWLATVMGDALNAAVPYYGVAAETASVPKIKAPLLIHLAENDQRVNETYPAYEQALKDAGVRYELHRYPGTQHGFHNDSTPRYDEAAAKLSWERTVAFFEKHLEVARQG